MLGQAERHVFVRECRPPCIAESSDNNNNYFDYFYTSFYEYDWYGTVTSFRLPVGTPPQPHRGAFPSTAPEAPLAQSPVVSPTPEYQ